MYLGLITLIEFVSQEILFCISWKCLQFLLQCEYLGNGAQMAPLPDIINIHYLLSLYLFITDNWL